MVVREIIFRKASLLLFASGICFGIVGFHLDIFLENIFLLWTLISLLLAFGGYFFGKQIEKLNALTQLEPQTNLINRNYFRILSIKAIKNQKYKQSPLCFVVIDIDNFKNINDNLGHSAGDKTLQSIAGIIKNNTRSFDILTRWGGDEFALLLPNTTAEDAKQICERIRLAVIQNSPVSYTPTLSIGIFCAYDKMSYEYLFEMADIAMLKAKKSKNSVFLIASDFVQRASA